MRTINRIALPVAFLPLAVLAASPAMKSPSSPALQVSTAAARLYDLSAREAQYRALLAMPKVQVQYAQSGRVELVEGSTAMFPAVKGLREGDRPDALMRQLGPLLLATPSDGLRVRSLEDRKVRSEGFDAGGYDVFLEQTINGLPVIDATVNLRTSDAGEMVVLSSRFVPAAGASRTPALTLAGVKDVVRNDLVAGGRAVTGSVQLEADGQLGYWTGGGQVERPVLVWILHATFRSAREQGEMESVEIAADAATGEVRRLQPTTFGMRRIVYSLNGEYDYVNKPWTLLWDESPPNYGNAQAVTLWNNVPKARDLWATVGWHYETVNLVAQWGDTNNALYDTRGGIPSIISGDNVALDLDTVAHEYGHGVFMARATAQPSAWWNEWFAANEFWGDLSAVFTDMAQRNQAYSDPNTWQLSPINGSPIRDLSNPKNPLVYQAAYQNYQDWYPTRSWCCSTSGVAHRNMTIFGHALYLLRHGGVHSRAGAQWSSLPFAGGTIPTIPVTQISDNTLLKQIFVQALSDMRLYNVEINGYNIKFYTAAAANAMWGPVLKANVESAWTAVGIGHACSAPPPVPTYNLSSWFCKGRYDMDWPQQAGVTYHAQVAPGFYPFETYGSTVTDGQVASCSVDLPAQGRWRIRACNGCGCSAWTAAETLFYYSPCL